MNFFRRILKTSVFRLSLLYAILFSLIAAAALISIYKVAENQINEQVDTRLQLETNILLKHYRNAAVEGLIASIRFYNNKEDRPFYIYALIHRSGLDLTRFIPADGVMKTQNQIFASMPLGDVVDYVPYGKKDDKVRMLLTLLPGGYQLLVGAELEETQHLLNRLFQATLAAISIIFTLSILIGIVMARKMVKRINAVTTTADTIIEGDFSQRIPIVPDRDNELDRLSESLNRMLDRIESLMQGMQQVTNNLAHDLRNPLNRIRHRLESAQLTQMTQQEYAVMTEHTIEDIDGVISTFNALLSIAQIESGIPRKDWDDFSLNIVLNDLSEIYEAVAKEKNLQWEYHASENLQLQGNKQLIAQLLGNLLDNAFKYTPEGGKVTLTAEYAKPTGMQKPDHKLGKQRPVHITIADNGDGIPLEEHKEVFKRFHRLDNARSTEGNGLGLSLVKAVADLHGATIDLRDNHPGLSVTIVFDDLKKL